MNLRDAPFCGVEAPNEECQNNVNRIHALLDALVEQNVTDEENVLLDLVTDCLIYNRFGYGASPEALLDRAQTAYTSQLEDAEVWAWK